MMSDRQDIEAMTAAELVEEGWFEDESGLPIFKAASADAIDQELLDQRAEEGTVKLKTAAVLTEASEKRFYGEGTLKRVCEENQIRLSTAWSMIASYKRLRGLEILERSRIVSAVLSGELFWSKTEIAAPIEDDVSYAGLLNEAANGGLSASELRKRVKALKAKLGGGSEADVKRLEDPREPCPYCNGTGWIYERRTE